MIWCQGYILYFLRRCTMAMPEGSKPAETVPRDCNSAQGARSNLVHAVCREWSLSWIDLKTSPGTASERPSWLTLEKAREPRDVWTTVIDHRSGTSKGAKLLDSIATRGVILNAAPLVRLAFLKNVFQMYSFAFDISWSYIGVFCIRMFA